MISTIEVSNFEVLNEKDLQTVNGGGAVVTAAKAIAKVAAVAYGAGYVVGKTIAHRLNDRDKEK